MNKAEKMTQKPTPVYALLDVDLLRRYDVSAEKSAKFLQANAITIAQLRDKEGSDDEVAALLRSIRSLYEGTLLVNDRPALAELCDGVHLGQEDLAAFDPDPSQAVRKVRAILGSGKILGLSTHDAREIALANPLDLDYIGLGAYRPTSTKSGARVRGAELLEAAKGSRHPVALIGGLRWEDRFPPQIAYKVLGSALIERIAAS